MRLACSQYPVTSLLHTNGTCFVGHGPFLNKQRVFEYERVHGIRLCGGRVACFGGRSYSLDGVEIRVDEWILDLALRDNGVLLITARNQLILNGSIDYRGGPLLTAAKLAKEVITGDIFGTIRIGNVKFTGHEGCITTLLPLDEALVSGSEDRSVRVWSYSGQQRYVVYGNGRVWDLCAVADSFAVASEDPFARVYNLNGDLQHCTDRVHSGKSIWAVTWDGEKLISGGADGRVILHSINPKQLIVRNSNSFKDYTVLKERVIGLSRLGEIFMDGKKLYGHSNLMGYGIIEASEEYIIVGDRNGSLHVLGTEHYVVDVSNKQIIRLFVEAINGSSSVLVATRTSSYVVSLTSHMIWKLDTGLTVTAYCPLEDERFLLGTRSGRLIIEHGKVIKTTKCFHDSITSISQQGSLIYCTSRNGTWAVLKDSLEVLHMCSPRLGPIEGLSKLNGENVLYGFRTTQFWVWNETKRYFLANFECGGSHRTNYFLINAAGMHFTFTKRNEIWTCSQSIPCNPIIKEGIHGREIRAVLAYPKDKRILLTAAEDTTIRISRLVGSELVLLAVLADHIAGVQCLAFLPDGSHFFSGAGHCELFVWRFTYIDRQPYVALVCRADVVGESDLRVTGICAFDRSAVAGFSDGSIRSYDLIENKLVLKYTGQYKIRCIQTINRLNESFLISATDGSIALFDQQLHCITQAWVHQSGITSLHAANGGTKWIIYSGGDDGRIGESIIKDNSIEILHRTEQAHAGAVTGLLLSAGLLYSAGIDCRLKVWRDHQLQTETVLGIADVGDMIDLDHAILAVGVGIEIYEKDTA